MSRVTCGTASGCADCPIAAGFCLPESLAALETGRRATVRRLAVAKAGDLRKLLALGLMPGVEVEVERRWPAVVVRIDRASVALDEALAQAVVVSRQRSAVGRQKGAR